MNLKRCLWAINCLRIYCHLQPAKTTSRNLRKVNRSTKGYPSVWRRHIGRQHGGRKAMGNIWSLIWLSPTKHFFSGSAELENVTSRYLKLKEHKANRYFRAGDKSEFSEATRGYVGDKIQNSHRD